MEFRNDSLLLESSSYMPCEIHPATLLQKLYRESVSLGFINITGGTVCLMHNDEIYVAPAQDVLIVQPKQKFPSLENGVKLSACVKICGIFFKARNVRAVFHSHSKWANMVTTVGTGDFTISAQDVLSSIKNPATGAYMRRTDVLTIIIVDWVDDEAEMNRRIIRAVERQMSDAVLIRGHGLYVWADTWQEAKSMCQKLDYLFEIAVRMKRTAAETPVKTGSPVTVELIGNGPYTEPNHQQVAKDISLWVDRIGEHGIEQDVKILLQTLNEKVTSKEEVTDMTWRRVAQIVDETIKENFKLKEQLFSLEAAYANVCRRMLIGFDE